MAGGGEKARWVSGGLYNVHWGLSGFLVLDEWRAEPNKPQRIGVEGLSRQELTA